MLLSGATVDRSPGEAAQAATIRVAAADSSPSSRSTQASEAELPGADAVVDLTSVIVLPPASWISLPWRRGGFLRRRPAAGP